MQIHRQPHLSELRAANRGDIKQVGERMNMAGFWPSRKSQAMRISARSPKIT
jgi:hypothetical protein